MKTSLLILIAAVLCGADADCVWYGKCGRDPKFGDDRHVLNCVYDGPAKEASKNDLETLREICPHLAEFSSLCCSSQQIRDMAENFALPSAVLERCPTCLANFRKNFCDLTCHPEQARFANASKVVTAAAFDGRDKLMVEEMTYYVHDEFNERTFDSCKNVVNSATSNLAMNMLCGPWGAALCTPRRWFDYMGSISNGYSPFNIIYDYGVEDFRHNPEVTPCDQSVGDSAACSCTDCETACQRPEFDAFAADDETCTVFKGINCVSFAMLLLFVVGSVIFLAIVFVSTTMRNYASTPGSPPPEDVDAIDGAPMMNNAKDDLSIIDKTGVFMENFITDFFTSWGTTCAKYPVPVMILSVGFALGLTTGVKWLQVETDPIELWAAPESRSRVEKDFYDQTFRPFYRTAQIIVHAKDLDDFSHVDIFDERRLFGPVFNDSAFLLPLLQLQKDIEAIVAEDGTTLADVCNAPLSPQSPICNIQSVWAYWQDDPENLAKSGLNEQTGHVDTYLDHFLLCSR